MQKCGQSRYWNTDTGLTFLSLSVSLRTTSFNSQKFYTMLFTFTFHV